MWTLFLFILMIGFGFLCRFIVLTVFDSFFKNKEEETHTYIDKSIHHHYHDNRSIHLDGNKITPNGKESTIDV